MNPSSPSVSDRTERGLGDSQGKRRKIRRDVATARRFDAVPHPRRQTLDDLLFDAADVLHGEARLLTERRPRDHQKAGDNRQQSDADDDRGKPLRPTVLNEPSNRRVQGHGPTLFPDVPASKLGLARCDEGVSRWMLRDLGTAVPNGSR
jgi:hypothetical protein